MQFLKKNQIILYSAVLMLMVAGYFNYTANGTNTSLETGVQIGSKSDEKLADIGDATLVNSNDVVTGENKTEEVSKEENKIENTTTQNNTTNNTTTENNVVQTNSSNNNDYFVKSKLERETMYSQMIGSYEKILNSSNAVELQRQTATQEISKINETKNKIMICENLIKTKGFDNSVIFVNGESISVIIGAIELKQEEVAQIQNIVSREINAKIENIHISTK